MTDLFVTQDEYDDLVEQLILKVADDGYDFDCILCLARGGMRVGDIFSRVHDMPLAILATSSYREAAGKQQGDLAMADKVSVQLQLTDPDLKSRDRVVKKTEKDSLYAAMDVASVWLDRALSGK